MASLLRTSLVTQKALPESGKIDGTGLAGDEFIGRWGMEVGVALARQTRGQHRHELRTLSYASVEQANGGIVRNINHSGIGLQVVAAVVSQQQVRVRFELNHPRLRIETLGEVSWSTRSGQCGVRFVDLPPKTARQIDEWILGNMLEGACAHSERAGFLFPRTASIFQGAEEEDDGLMTSATPVLVIEVPKWVDPLQPVHVNGGAGAATQSVSATSIGLGWLSQALTGRGLIWTINSLVIVAAMLLFAVVFLSIAGEPPKWPVATAIGSAIFVGALYWGFFRLFGGTSPGVRLARLAGWDVEEEEARDSRFR
ncbi:MAG TPA: PilZ domain-containing protein [Candidatus Sulfotelmatobacter sp.]|jgi:hypothetical protein|nr:PilZ domain-containing protein [Candidatus Sulfotelmatobacter sp.]